MGATLGPQQVPKAESLAGEQCPGSSYILGSLMHYTDSQNTKIIWRENHDKIKLPLPPHMQNIFSPDLHWSQKW